MLTRAGQEADFATVGIEGESSKPMAILDMTDQQAPHNCAIPRGSAMSERGPNVGMEKWTSTMRERVCSSPI